MVCNPVKVCIHSLNLTELIHRFYCFYAFKNFKTNIDLKDKLHSSIHIVECFLLALRGFLLELKLFLLIKTIEHHSFNVGTLSIHKLSIKET